MKMSHRLSSRTAGPVWGLVFGLLMTAIGVGLWCYATMAATVGQFDESFAVAAMLVGLFSAVYAGRELTHKHR